MTRERRTYRRLGFTLLEVTLVVIILGLVGGLAIPWLASSLEDASIDAATEEVATALEYARLMAVNSGGAARVTFDTGAMTVVVERPTSPEADALRDTAQAKIGSTGIDAWTFQPVMNPVSPGKEYRVDLSRNARWGGAGIDDLATNFAGDQVEFDGIGVPSSGGTIGIVRGPRKTEITLDSLTGKVTVAQ